MWADVRQEGVARASRGLEVRSDGQVGPEGHLKHRKTIKIYAWLTRKQRRNCRVHYHTPAHTETHSHTAGESGGRKLRKITEGQDM